MNYDIKFDRYGAPAHSDQLGRLSYLAHGKGYVMARRPGCVPFAVTIQEWQAMEFWSAHLATIKEEGQRS
jgi:hypothetical protein